MPRRNAPQTKLPSSKTAMLIRKTVFIGKYLKALPQTDWVAATGKNMAAPYQPTSPRLLKSRVIFGIAVVMTVYSGSASINPISMNGLVGSLGSS
jgi:hypothetical protein